MPMNISSGTPYFPITVVLEMLLATTSSYLIVCSTHVTLLRVLSQGKIVLLSYILPDCEIGPYFLLFPLFGKIAQAKLDNGT